MGSVFARLCQSVGWDFHGRAVLCGYEYPPEPCAIDYYVVTTVGSPLRGDYLRRRPPVPADPETMLIGIVASTPSTPDDYPALAAGAASLAASRAARAVLHRVPSAAWLVERPSCSRVDWGCDRVFVLYGSFSPARRLAPQSGQRVWLETKLDAHAEGSSEQNVS